METEQRIEMCQRHERMIQEIHSAVVGNEDMGHEGLVKQVRRHQRWIDNANAKAWMVIGAASVLVFLIELFFKK